MTHSFPTRRASDLGYLVCGADDRLQAGHHDVRMLAHTPGDASVGGLGLDVGNCLGIGAGADRVLVVVAHLDLAAAILAPRVHAGRDGAVAAPLDTAPVPAPLAKAPGRDSESH